jgi:Myelin regulatory factor ICA domain
MENIGAIKELGKLSQSFNRRIAELERVFGQVADEPIAPDHPAQQVCAINTGQWMKIVQVMAFLLVVFVAWATKNLFFYSTN